MIRQALNHITVCSVLVVVIVSTGSADTVFIDTFNDGNADFPPAQWTPVPGFPGNYDASSGDYVLTTTGESRSSLISEVLGRSLSNTSVRSRVRSSGISAAAGLTVRNQNHVGDTQNYFGGVGYYPNNGGTVLFFARNDPGGDQVFFGGTPVLPFDVRSEDAMIQLDAIGSEIKLWGWRAGAPMPDQPQIILSDNTYASGTVRVFNTFGNNDNVATFRFVHVADTHIPEPSSVVLAGLTCAGLLSGRRRRDATIH